MAGTALAAPTRFQTDDGSFAVTFPTAYRSIAVPSIKSSAHALFGPEVFDVIVHSELYKPAELLPSVHRMHPKSKIDHIRWGGVEFVEHLDDGRSVATKFAREFVVRGQRIEMVVLTSGKQLSPAGRKFLDSVEVKE